MICILAFMSICWCIYIYTHIYHILICISPYDIITLFAYIICSRYVRVFRCIWACTVYTHIRMRSNLYTWTYIHIHTVRNIPVSVSTHRLCEKAEFAFSRRLENANSATCICMCPTHISSLYMYRYTHYCVYTYIICICIYTYSHKSINMSISAHAYIYI